MSDHIEETNPNTDNDNKQKSCCGGCRRTPSGGKLSCYDWLADIPEARQENDLVEVQFKNTRKGYYHNSNNLPIEVGDIVAVEATPGHDIGTVTLMGKLVPLQMKKNGVRTGVDELKRVYRKAKPNDLEKYEESKRREHITMLRARSIAEELHLKMKIGDVEYQGDGNKAIFYYIADDRVDFRQLIKVLAENFKVRIEMKQIGARQEAGRIGGIGPCGRQLCCSGWMTNFVSVATSAARYQDISLNPQKLAGQCAKLKCCLNFEVDAYVESQKKLPSREVALETKDSTYYHFKTDIFKQEITYSTSKDVPANLVTIPAERVFEVIALNKRGERPEALQTTSTPKVVKKEFQDVVGQDSLTRFDKSKKKGNNNRNNRNRNRNEGGGEGKEPRKPNREGGDRDKPQPNRNKPRNNSRGENRGQKEGDNQNNGSQQQRPRPVVKKRPNPATKEGNQTPSKPSEPKREVKKNNEKGSE